MINLLIDILKDSSAVTDIVPSDRIFPLIRLQGSDVPAIVLQLTGADPSDTKDSPSTLDLNSVQISTFAPDPATVWAAMSAIRSALDGYTGGQIAEIRFETHASDVFDTTEVYSMTARYEVRLYRDSSTAAINAAGLGLPLRMQGAVFSDVDRVVAFAGASYSIDDDDSIILVDYAPDSAHGTTTLYLPPVAESQGRIIRIKAGGEVDHQHDLEVRPYPSDTATIDGEAVQTTDRAYCSATLLCWEGQWYCLQITNKT